MGRKDQFEALEAEFAREKAHSLSRIAARMEMALAELRAFDGADEATRAGASREELLVTAAEWVWYYVVQRDILGWHRHEEALRFYQVPAEVLARMGPRPRR